MHTSGRNQQPWQRVLLKWRGNFSIRTADDFRQFVQHNELVRCQDNDLATIEVANYLQTWAPVVLVVQTAGENDKCQAESAIWSIRKASKRSIGFYRRWCNFESTQPKRCWLSTRDREQLGEQNAIGVTPLVFWGKIFVSSQQICILCDCKRLQTSRFLSEPPKRNLQS